MAAVLALIMLPIIASIGFFIGVVRFDGSLAAAFAGAVLGPRARRPRAPLLSRLPAAIARELVPAGQSWSPRSCSSWLSRARRRSARN